MEERKRSKKGLLIIIAALAAIVGGVFLVIKIFFGGEKIIEGEAIVKQFTKFYQEDGIEQKDSSEASARFGLPVNSDGEITFLTNFEMNDLEGKENLVLVLFIKTENEEEYFEAIETALQVEGDLEDNAVEGEDEVGGIIEDKENSKVQELVFSAILKKGDGYVYLTMGDDARLLERELLMLK